MTRRMAEYRRGRWYDVGAVVTSAASGFTAGYHTQKNADLRIGGAPVTAVAGVPGILAGALLDESVVTRAVFAVGGTMFMVGATTYALIHPQAREADHGHAGLPRVRVLTAAGSPVARLQAVDEDGHELRLEVPPPRRARPPRATCSS
jgi:hypothetical protein